MQTALRNRRDRFLFFLSINGLACLCAFGVAGLFEYNFGDSEVLILLLFFVGAPFAAARDERAAPIVAGTKAAAMG